MKVVPESREGVRAERIGVSEKGQRGLEGSRFGAYLTISYILNLANPT